MGHEKSRHGKKTSAFEFAIEDTDGTPKTRLVIKSLEIAAASSERGKEIRSHLAASAGPKTRPMLYDEFVTKRGWNERTFKRALKVALDNYMIERKQDEKQKSLLWFSIPQEKEKLKPSEPVCLFPKHIPEEEEKDGQ